MKILTTLLGGVLAMGLQGAAVGTTTVSPTTAVVGTSTLVTVQASITDPTLLSGGANLLQLNPDGTTTILGVMHDDGLNGDQFAGDGIYTLTVTLNQASAAQVQLQVSVAFRGLLARVKSQVMNVFFQPASAPQQSLAVLATFLTAGNISQALNYVVPSIKNTNLLNSLHTTGLATLASLLNASVLVSSQNDLRIFQAPFITPSGETTTVELSMVPDNNGVWRVNTW